MKRFGKEEIGPKRFAGSTSSSTGERPRSLSPGLIWPRERGGCSRVNADFDGRSNGHWGSKQRKSLRLWTLQQGLAVFIIYSHPKSSQAWLSLGVSRIVNDRELWDERKLLSYKLLCRRWPKCHAYPRFRLGKVCVDPGGCSSRCARGQRLPHPRGSSRDHADVESFTQPSLRAPAFFARLLLTAVPPDAILHDGLFVGKSVLTSLPGPGLNRMVACPSPEDGALGYRPTHRT